MTAARQIFMAIAAASVVAASIVLGIQWWIPLCLFLAGSVGPILVVLRFRAQGSGGTDSGRDDMSLRDRSHDVSLPPTT